MIHCPNCGSTAQVKELSTELSCGAGGQYIKYINCECGCGTKFYHATGYNDAGDVCHTSIHIEKDE